MADHDQAAGERLEEVAQPDDRVGVEVVGRLVEQQRLRVGEQDPGQLDPAPLAAGEGLQLLAEQPVGDAEAVRDRRRLRLGGVSPAGVQLGVGALVAPHRPLAHGRVVTAHLVLGGPQTSYDVVETARGEDPLAGELVGVPERGSCGR